MDMKQVALKIKKMLPAASLGISAAFVIFWTALTAIPFESENTVNVFDSTVRLRVVANSDSECDQKLKLAVRDDIIGLASEIFADCGSIENAEKAVNKNMGRLLHAAEASVKSHGSDMAVSISFGKEKCPVRRYSEFTFPAGEYTTLRINLGKAEGENWWCVMYPPLCVSAATGDVYADRATFISCGFSEAQVESLMSENGEKTEIRFAAADFVQRLLG